MEPAAGKEVARLLQDRLNALTDLHLTLKHIHWNVVGPHFIAVHEMLDPQVDAIRLMADTLAERIATLGAEPKGTPGALVSARTWDDYSLNRAGALEHLAALNLVYDGVISDHRAAIDSTEEPDPVTQDILIGQSAQLEQYQWFVRAHLERSSGDLVSEGEAREADAARAVPADYEPAASKKSAPRKAAKKAAKKAARQ
ncbi:MAG: DNA starvation/stationary phase protection protein [Geodermatophilaceae bacterium]|nr:DNA starvation/stationary phase protection protein [Geodermatophilaceae bacterium]MDQ3456311.1 DNA starvation/stationary phase protection protein [Actinomycetota bacterium]